MSTPVLFKKEVVAKKNWYARIKEIMIDAGWQNLSSKPSTDFDVMYSIGESGNIPMYIQLKEYNTNPSNSISNASDRHLYVRLPGKYTPGSPGQAGTFQRSNEDWYAILMAFDTFDKEKIFNMYYHCNKNRIIIINEFPAGAGERLYGTIQFIGISDRSMGENQLSAPVVAATHMYSTNGVRVSGHPTFPTGSYVVNVYMDLPPGRSTWGGTFMSEIGYGGGTAFNEGVRGFIDGIYALRSDEPINNIDTLIDKDGNRYKVVKADPFYGYGFYGAFKDTTLYAFRTE